MSPSGSAVAHGGNPQDRAASPTSMFRGDQDIDTLVVMTECKVSKATFYRAIAKFQELELFDFQDQGISIRNLNGVFSLRNETTVSKMRKSIAKTQF
ncbi:hypothetical protein VB711_14410 [Cronbergia sp. UHCC 0137]|uniref:hypothetical protein n=1 Tax=Cronbergia sp. UHCC 0137 TaxID=3110239 RepID=UPI002B21317B|nr:hypothetical protein [Cronbergia sp. UHCC 0137]MEA5619024.1 hypothetical protein [Cronbergia sp. UHCC 0137]